MPTPSKAPLRPVTSWSFSRYIDYKTCPARFRYKHLDRLTEPPNAAMQRGADVHKLAEDYTKGLLKRLPAELKLFKDEFAMLKKQKVKYVEENWGFDRAWNPVPWNDWANCWLRVKLDVAYVNVEHNVAVPIDHKTGRPRDDKNAEYEQQLELYGAGTLAQLPEVSAASPRLWYLDAGVVYPDPEVREITFVRKDELKLRKKWEAAVKPMFTDKVFKPTPSNACRWCHFRKDNGGPCQY